MTDREGKYAPLQQELQTVLTRVYERVEERNLIHNGVTDWTVIGDVNPNTEGLLFTDQYTSIPQTIQLENRKEDTEYTLSVSIKGKGIVTLQHAEDNLETMTVTSDFLSIQTNTFYLEGAIVEITVQANDAALLLRNIVSQEGNIR
ncbi:hypothetical protein [Bacillus wiedmannii]|uniref:hypothetical protein n=1 Tax=Bacillus wiedmannii TaxID=1890302 RepID=UPI000BEB622D|nr:hypothetical protein [Bacillus wiedmannii]PDZ42313.1 hypothetical protein CON82_30290 [Bacillus wiedmannii]